MISTSNLMINIDSFFIRPFMMYLTEKCENLTTILTDEKYYFVLSFVIAPNNCIDFSAQRSNTSYVVLGSLHSTPTWNKGVHQASPNPTHDTCAPVWRTLTTISCGSCADCPHFTSSSNRRRRVGAVADTSLWSYSYICFTWLMHDRSSMRIHFDVYGNFTDIRKKI